MAIELKLIFDEKEIANEIYNLNYDENEDCVPNYLNSKEEVVEWVRIVTHINCLVIPDYYLYFICKELAKKPINILTFPFESFINERKYKKEGK